MSADVYARLSGISTDRTLHREPTSGQLLLQLVLFLAVAGGFGVALSIIALALVTGGGFAILAFGTARSFGRIADTGLVIGSVGLVGFVLARSIIGRRNRID